jgi:hypothetical protein
MMKGIENSNRDGRRLQGLRMLTGMENGNREDGW